MLVMDKESVSQASGLKTITEILVLSKESILKEQQCFKASYHYHSLKIQNVFPAE